MHLTRMKRAAMLLALCLVAAVAFAATASAKEVYHAKVDNFIFFIDHSGSMGFESADTGAMKIETAKSLAGHLNERIPELGYKGGVYTFAPFAAQKGMGAYKTKEFAGAIDGIATDFPIFQRSTTMGDGLASLEPVVAGLKGKTAVIIFSDGENNSGIDPVQQADVMAAKRLGKLCFHVVSLADSPAGQATLEAIAKINSCTVSVKGEDLMDEKAMTTFIEKVFYDVEIVPDPVKPKAKMKKKAAAPVSEVVNFRSVNFDFDSAKIKDEFVPVLDEAVTIVKDSPGTVVLTGHTDATGPEAYNQNLSERRAEAVKAYFEAKGVKASRLDAQGLGESAPKYDNNTREGRALNRRVEMQLK